MGALLSCWQSDRSTQIPWGRYTAGSFATLPTFTADQATVLFNTNVIGILRTSRAVLPSMREMTDSSSMSAQSSVE